MEMVGELMKHLPDMLSGAAAMQQPSGAQVEEQDESGSEYDTDDDEDDDSKRPEPETALTLDDKTGDTYLRISL